MIFSSYIFIFAFLPITFVGYFLLSKVKKIQIQHVFLVIMSLVFYGWYNPKYVLVIISSIVINYSLSLALQKSSVKSGIKRAVFVVGILFNIGMLLFFKYMDFFIENINALFKSDFVMLNIALPLGISFFTFQQFSFIISAYKGTSKVENFIDYSLFVTFFPQLIAGPIVLYEEMMPQFVDESRRKINIENVCKGIYIFVLGFAKKIILADSLSVIVTNGFTKSETDSMVAAWLTALAYTFQIFFDFSGYCDMATGAALMFNIELPLNFDSPYKSKNIREFWRRWHITLGRALTTYVYIPLGGNRKGKLRTYFNLMITFLASGLWHGASWTFVVWGAIHGIASVFDRVFERQQKRIPGAIRTVITFVFITLSWVLFRAENWKTAINIYKAMFNFGNIGNFPEICELFYDGITSVPVIVEFGFIVLIFACSFGLMKLKNVKELSSSFKMSSRSAVIIAILAAVSVIHLVRLSPFIYFNF